MKNNALTHLPGHTTCFLMLLTVVCTLAACDSSSSQTDDFVITYNPTFNAANFQANIDNPYYPLVPGTTSRFRAETDEGIEEIVVEVLDETRVIAGVTARVVRDRAFLNGALIEDTFDWFAQDTDGNVWYMGEATEDFENGQVVSTSGSWEAGVDGARAGIVMPAQPAVGQAFEQEFYAGEAEDRGAVIALNQSVTVPFGSFTNCIQTEDTTPLEPDVLEYKYYCPGIGVVLEVVPKDNERVELISVTRQQ